MHFFSPANVMKLCEIVRAEKTAPDALMTAVAVARKHRQGAGSGRRVCDGFVGNRMLSARSKQSEKLLVSKVRCRSRSMPSSRNSVMPMGPFAMGDLAGLDIGWRSRQDRGIKSADRRTHCAKLAVFGQKTGKGYYKYEAGSRAPIPDPEVEKLIDDTLQEARSHAPHRSAIRKFWSA